MSDSPENGNNLIIPTAKGTIHLWLANDYEARLKDGANKRDIEQGEVRLKLGQLGYDGELEYKRTGQPVLVGHSDVFLSISHCNGWMCLYLANEPVGVDIELPRENMLRGKDYFVNAEEQKEELSETFLRLIWGGKEAIFKLFEGQIQDLKNEVVTSNVDLELQKFTLSYKNQEYQFYWKSWHNLFIVYQ